LLPNGSGFFESFEVFFPDFSAPAFFAPAIANPAGGSYYTG
jgi:hypothetical protein